MQNNSLEFVNNLYTLCKNPESYRYIAGVASMGVQNSPLDQNVAQTAANELSKYLPQKQPDQMASFGAFGGVMGVNGVPPPAIGGYQMSAPAFNPGGIPGTVASSSAKNFYTEADFRNLINSGKVVCHRTIAGNSARKGSYCCSEVKNVDQSKPMDQQCCNTHNRASKSKTAMSSNSIASAFTNLANTQFAAPLGMNQNGMMSQPMNGGMQSNIPGLNIPGVNMQNQFNQPQQGLQPWNQPQQQMNNMQPSNSMGLVTQQNPMGQQQIQIPPLPGLNQNSQTPNQQMSNPMSQQNPMGQQMSNPLSQQIQIPSLPGLNLNNQTPNQQMSNPLGQQNHMSQQMSNPMGQQNSSSNPFIIPSNPGVNLSAPSQQNNFNQQMQTPFNFNSQQNPSNSQQPLAPMFQQPQMQQFNSQIPSINLNSAPSQTQMQQFNPQIPSINLTNMPSITPLATSNFNDSLNSTINGMGNLSLGNSQMQPSQQMQQSNVGEFFMRRLGNEEFYFNTDPIVTGLVFENSLNGMVCIGRIGTAVKNDGSELPPDFKGLLGSGFTIDHENWLSMKGISKKESEIMRESTEQISDEYLPVDA